MTSGPSAIGDRLATGDRLALEECYAALGPLVLSYLRRYLGREDAEDVLQRVFIEVWRSADRFDPTRSIEAWVLGIARKRAIDSLRQRRATVVPIDTLRGLAGEDGRDVADRLAFAAEVRAAVASLPAGQRAALHLADFESRTQGEIAAELGVPLNTVKSWTARGLRRLAGSFGYGAEGS